MNFQKGHDNVIITRGGIVDGVILDDLAAGNTANAVSVAIRV